VDRVEAGFLKPQLFDRGHKALLGVDGLEHNRPILAKWVEKRLPDDRREVPLLLGVDILAESARERGDPVETHRIERH